MLGQSVSEGLYLVGAVCEELQPVGRTQAHVHGRHSTLEQGEHVKKPPREDEGITETMCGGLTTEPVTIPLHC